MLWTVVLEKILGVPWTARRSKQSVLKEINPEYSSKGLLLKFQYFGHLMWRANSVEKSLMLKEKKGATEDDMVRQHHWLNGHESEQTPRESGGQGSLACYNKRGPRVGHNLVTQQHQQNLEGRRSERPYRLKENRASFRDGLKGPI